MTRGRLQPDHQHRAPARQRRASIKRAASAVTGLTFALILQAGCGGDHGAHQASDDDAIDRAAICAPAMEAREMALVGGWARAASQGRVSAGYVTICNGTARDITLTGVQTADAARSELHLTRRNDEGIVSMSPVSDLIIPAGAVVNLAPGGLHIMVMNTRRDLEPGDTLDMTLTFAGPADDTLTRAAALTVRAPSALGDTHSGH